MKGALVNLTEPGVGEMVAEADRSRAKPSRDDLPVLRFCNDRVKAGAFTS